MSWTVFDEQTDFYKVCSEDYKHQERPKSDSWLWSFLN